MSKKIAIIIERANIVLGGAERSVFELSSALSVLGFDVDILAAKGQTNTKNIHILCNDKMGERVCYVTFAKVLKKYLSENHYDIIHSVLPFDFADIYQPRGGSFAESILRNAVSYENKIIESYKKLTAFANFRRTMLLRAERKLCKNPDGPIVAALSEYVAQQFRDHYGLDDKRIVVVPNGVKTNKRIDKADADILQSQIMAKLGIKEGERPVFLLFVANNFRLKGLAVLIKAMKLASARRVYLIVAGHGKAYKYRHMAKKYGVNKKIIFMGDVRHIQNVLSIADVALLPDFYDPSSRYII